MINESRHWPSMAFNITERKTTRFTSYNSISMKYSCQTIKPESDHASKSNYQFAGNAEDKRICHMRPLGCSQQPPDGWKFCWTNNPVSSKNRLQGVGKKERQTDR